jgi:hypothetical protein
MGQLAFSERGNNRRAKKERSWQTGARIQQAESRELRNTGKMEYRNNGTKKTSVSIFLFDPTFDHSNIPAPLGDLPEFWILDFHF